MGIGRFAYTPILPLMKSEAGVSDALAGILAAGNYLGYLVGALLAARPFWRTRRVTTIRWALAAACATTFAMSLSSDPVVWFGLRFASGVASAFVLILVSSVVLDRASRDRNTSWPGILYAGVGIGITLTGIAVPLLAWGGWRASWIGLGLLSTLLCAALLPGLSDRDTEPVAVAAGGAGERPNPVRYWSLGIAYFAVGIGYIIPATFIVAIFRATPQLAPIASLSWIIVGLVAVPSPILWGRLGARFGRLPMLELALLILGAGIVAPTYARNVFGAMFSAAALGGTFAGITTLVNLEARALFPHSSNRAIGELTAAFGVGQIIGPLIVSAIATSGGSYDLALIAGGATVAVGFASVAAGRLATKTASS
jgi:MFS family permease